jgi:hypothetical protein
MDIVVALGVVSWVRCPEQAMSEMRRVIGEGGYVLFSAYNSYSLRDILDPARNVFLGPLRRAGKRFISGDRRGDARPMPRPYGRSDVTRLISAAGMASVRSATLGFGPLTYLRRPILSRTVDVHVHRYLQWLADHAVPGIRSTGRFRLVLAAPRA